MFEPYVIYEVLPLLLYILISIAVWRRSSRIQIESLKEYAVGYSGITTSVLVCGILATSIGAGTVIREVGDFFAAGMALFFMQISRILSYLIASKIFSPNIKEFKDCLSIGHVMDKLYGKTCRLVTVSMAIPVQIGLLSVQVIAIAMIMTNLLIIPDQVALILAFTLVTIFSLMGGVRILTHIGVVQSILFFLVLPISCLAVSASHGGYDRFSASLPIMDWKSNTYTGWMLFSMFIYGLLPDCSSSFIQKCLIARDKNQLANALKTVGIIHIPIILSLCFIAYSVRAAYPSINPDQTIFYYINELAPMALRGIFSVCLIAIIMGMSDGILHATSTIVANDVIKVLFPKTKEEWLIKSARISIVLFSGVAMAFTFFSESILSIVYVMYSFWAPIIIIPLCAGFLGVKAKNKEFIASTIAAALAVSCGYYFNLFPPVVLISGVIASFISFFAAHFMMKDGGSIDAFKEGLEKHFIMNMSSFKSWLKSHVIFPDEADMELGQRQIYQKFSVVMTAMMFIYMIVMQQGQAYEMMVGLISMGYLMSTLLMIRDLLFRKHSDKLLKLLWYTSLGMIPIISSYAILINNGSNMILANAVISLMALGLFTNAVSFIILLTIGCIAGLSVYISSFDITENIINASSLFFSYCIVATIGIYFLRSRERAVQEEVGRMHVVSGSMAHEVKTPMAVNLAYAETVKMIIADGKAKELKNKVLIEFSKQQYQDLQMFLQSMVDLSVNSAKTVDMLLMSMKKSMDGVQKSEFLLMDAVKKGVDGYLASNSNAVVNIDLPKKTKVFGAETYFANMIQNLVKNAFVHGGPKVEVKIYMQGESLIIEDSGLGIPADIVPLIFGSFYTKSKDGTGLGLAFSKMVVTDMGGTISCESEEEKYTRFIITVPLLV